MPLSTHLYSGAGRQRAHGKLPKLPLRPSAITLALFSAFLSVSQNAAAQCATGGNVTINATCTGDIVADTLNVEAVSGVQPEVNGNVTGANASAANNTLTLKGYNVHIGSASSRKYAYVNGAIANFGRIVVDYSPASSSLQGGTTTNPLLVITNDTNTTLDTGSNPNEAVEIDILCVRSGGSCTNKHFKFVGDIQGDGGLTVNLVSSDSSSPDANLRLVLSGANNTYTGLTTINMGRLQIGDDTGFSFNLNNDIHLAPEIGKVNYPTNADVDSAANAHSSTVIFHIPVGNTFQYDGMISGNHVTDPHMLTVPPNNAFIKTGAGEMILTRNHTYTGSTEVSAGILRIGNGGTTGMIGGVTGMGTASDVLKIYGATAIAIVDRSDDLTLPMPIHFRNGGTLVKENSNILTVTSMQTTSGNASLDIQEGALLYRPNADVEGTAPRRVLGFTGINLESGAQLILDIGTIESQERSYEVILGSNGGTISGAGELIKDGVGTLILRSDAQHTGGTTINAGTFQVGTNGGYAVNISGDVEVKEGASLVFLPWTAISSPADIRGSGDLIKGGRNVSTGTDDLSTVTLTGNLTHTGKTEVLTGGLVLAGNARLDTTSALILRNNTTFKDTTGVTQDIAHLEVTGTATYTGDFHAQSMQFNVTQDMIANGIVPLDVTGTADIGGTLLGISVDGSASGLNIGDSFRFLKATHVAGAPANGYTQQYGAGGLVGALVSVGFGIECNSGECIATVRDGHIREESKSILQGHLSGMAALVRSGDFLASQGIAAARQQLSRVYDEGQKIPEKGLWGTGIQPFVAHSGGMVRHETGSHIKTVGYNFLAGAVSGLRAPKGNVLAGVFFEYGKAEFDAYNAFNNQSVTGDGDTHHRGLGFFGRIEMESGLYAEGSVRGGKVDTVFQSDFLRDFHGTRADYTAHTRYTGAHVGLGKVWPLERISEKWSVDTYTQALWTRQNGDTVSLSTGEELDFDAVTSTRLKLGARVRYDASGHMAFYGGVAYDHEFSAKAKARLVNFGNAELPSSKLLGGTGMVEAGLLLTPSAYSPISVDLSVQGFAGRREGIMGSLRLNYYF